MNQDKNDQRSMWIEGIVAFIVGSLIWMYQTIKPPPSKICDTPNGPPVTCTRIRLRDGRYLAYKARGSPKETSRFKVILSHGFHASKETNIPVSDEWLQKMGIHLVTFDRPGYSESDPNPKRSPQEDAFDIEELVDQLKLGPKIYLIGLSIGCYPVWGFLKYMPQRLAGVALVVPLTNYWWPSLPVEMCNEAYGKLPMLERMRILALHYAPNLAWLLHKWFPVASIDVDFETNPEASFNGSDIEIMKKLTKSHAPDKDKIIQQGVYECEHRDMLVLHRKWEFDPLQMSNPFADEPQVLVHLWIGKQDMIISPELQRQIVKKLPWIICHEVVDVGHLFIHDETHCKNIFNSLLLGD